MNTITSKSHTTSNLVMFSFENIYLTFQNVSNHCFS